MANATAEVQAGIVIWGDDKIKFPVIATAQTWWGGIMTCLDGSGWLQQAADTAGYKFAGIYAQEGSPSIVFSGEANGDHNYLIERPWRFIMAIASAAQGDEGKRVYVVDNQTVGYTSSNTILVGQVDKVLTATSVLIAPIYATLYPVTLAGNVLAFTGATGVDQITFPTNLADALSFAQGSNLYLTFVTTTGSELTAIKSPAATGVTSNGGGITATAGTGGTTSGTGGTIVMAGGAGGAGSTTGPGGLVSLTGGASTGSSAGGSASLVGGAGGLVSTGGAAIITGGAGGATSGNGGAVTTTGGAGTGTSGVGGACTATGGAGVGASAGGASKIIGGAGGLTGAGGAVNVTGGAGGGTSGTGGVAAVAGGAGTGTSAAGGAASVTGGASPGASGTAGAASIDAGAAASGTGATVNISDVNATGTYLNRGPLKALQVGLTLTALGSNQSSTPTSAQLLGGFLTQASTTGAGTVGLPSGTNLSAACARTPVTGDTFDVFFSNIGTQTLTITGATGTTVAAGLNSGIVQSTSAILKFYNTGANTWTIYTKL